MNAEPVPARRRTSRRRRALRVTVAALIAAVVIAYTAYMLAGMPGMNHGIPATPSRDRPVPVVADRDTGGGPT